MQRAPWTLPWASVPTLGQLPNLYLPPPASLLGKICPCPWLHLLHPPSSPPLNQSIKPREFSSRIGLSPSLGPTATMVVEGGPSLHLGPQWPPVLSSWGLSGDLGPYGRQSPSQPATLANHFASLKPGFPGVPPRALRDNGGTLPACRRSSKVTFANSSSLQTLNSMAPVQAP